MLRGPWLVILLVTPSLLLADTSPGWTLAQLTPSGDPPGGQFGISVAASGNTVVVASASSAYVYVEPSSGWKNMTQTAKLTPTGEVAIAGDTVATCCSSNSAYVFVKPEGGWKDMTETATLTLPQAADWFHAIAISGNTIVVGNAAALINGNTQQGAVYVFIQPSSGWKGNIAPVAALTASDGAAQDGLGTSVSIDHDTIAAGAPTALQVNGAAYVFVKPPGGWADMTQTAKLTSSNPHATSVGWATSVSGSAVLVTGSFAAYVYVEPAGGWTNMTETAQLTNPAMGWDGVGTSLSISGPVIALGAPLAPNDEQYGAVYIFLQPASGWQTSTSPNVVLKGNKNTTQVGYSVSVTGSTLAAGAPFMNNYDGAAYVVGKR